MSTARRVVPLVLLPLVASTLAARAHAQCRQWDPTLAHASTVDRPIRVLATLDLGSGPELFAGGTFSNIGGIPVDGLARHTAGGWVAVGQGLGVSFFDGVYALAVHDDGTGPFLYAGGSFQPPPPGPQNVARFDGANWIALGNSLSDPAGSTLVEALLSAEIAGTRALYAAGTFTVSGSTVVNHVARWNGSAWQALGTGTDGPVVALAAYDDGTGTALYAGGTFASAGGIPARGIARWDGSAWSDVGGGTTGDVRALVVHEDAGGAALYAGGAFDHTGLVAVHHVARWDGIHWTALAGGVAHPTSNPSVEALASFDDGGGPALYAGGAFVTAGSVAASRVAKWDGASWSALDSGTDASVRGFAIFDDGTAGGPDLLAIGYFAIAGGVPSSPIAEWRGCAAGATFCAADGATTTCPCGNDGAHGHGCDNSQATGGAWLHGGRNAGLDSVVLTVTGEPTAAFCVFLQSSLASDPPSAYGDGRGCLAGTQRKLYSKHASGGAASAPESGDPSIQARSAALGDPLVTGATRYYQVAYRDPNPQFCPMPQGSTFNASNGLRLVW